MRIHIESCPFCSSTRVKVRKKNRTVIGGIEKRNTYCYCTICDSRGTRVLYDDYENSVDAEHKAIEYWNRRSDYGQNR